MCVCVDRGSVDRSKALLQGRWARKQAWSSSPLVRWTIKTAIRRCWPTSHVGRPSERPKPSHRNIPSGRVRTWASATSFASGSQACGQVRLSDAWSRCQCALHQVSQDRRGGALRSRTASTCGRTLRRANHSAPNSNLGVNGTERSALPPPPPHTLPGPWKQT